MALLNFLIEIFFILSRTAGTTNAKSSNTLSCNADSIPKPAYFGTSVTKLEAKEVRDWENHQPNGLTGADGTDELINFCNVTVTYTHPGLNDEVHVYVWLPLESWNGRLVAEGGGGFATGAECRLSNHTSAG